MAANLLLCISQDENVKPYKFKMTGVNVYSFEEALYHCYFYWKQSVDDFMSEDFVNWIGNTLRLSFIASKVKDLGNFPGLSRKFTLFLSIADYFSNEQIENLRKEIILWENRLEWEKLKERGDYLINNDEAEKAYHYYKKALEFGENMKLLNNISISLMKMGRYSEAIAYLDRALKLHPDDYNLLLHIAEAYVLNGEYAMADDTLTSLKQIYGDRGDIYYLYGEIKFSSARYFEAISYYEQAIETAENDSQKWEHMYRLSDVYLKLRFYDKALDMLDKIDNRDKYFLKKQADIYVQYNNIPAAVKCIEKALIKDQDSVDLWTRLAQYHRLDYDLSRANSAIVRALWLSPNNERANLEKARIKKSMGKIKEYQLILNGVLGKFKEKYRENEI